MSAFSSPAEQAYYAAQCAQLPALVSALDQILGGQQKVMVRDGDRVVEYGRADAKTLQARITRLERICFSCGPRAVRAGPRPGWGLNGPRGRSFYRGNDHDPNRSYRSHRQ